MTAPVDELAALTEPEARAPEQLGGAAKLDGVATLDDALDARENDLEAWEQEPPLPPLRVGLAVAMPTIAAGIMIGGVFEGVQGKVYPSLAGLCGIAIAAQASRRRSALVANLTIILGIGAIGVLLVVPAGADNVTRLISLLREAKASSHVLRPPAEFLPGYRALVGWILGAVGFAAGWVGIELRRPGLGLLIPLPLIAMGAISVPDDAKLISGIAALVLFVLGLAMHSSLRNVQTGQGDAPGLAFEARRALRALPLVAGLIVLLVLASRTNVLFPQPIIDPVRDAQRPKPVPLSAVVDRVLFEVRSDSSGPWRLGLLDVYDGREWRLPAFAESALRPVPRSGIVDPLLEPGVRADFLVKGLGGAVLPGVPNTYGIIAEGPKLAYDPRTGNIRLAEGQIHAGLAYTVTAAALPTEDALRAVDATLPPALRRFIDMPSPPPAVAELLTQAPASPAWDRMEFLRHRFLQTVTAAGAGTPVPVPPSKVQDMLAGSKEGSPFEIVAAQAMLARWAGVPARIGYGFDGGDQVSPGVRQVRPKHGASWLEVNFPGYGWLPIIGSPLKAKASLSAKGPTNDDPNVVPSDNIAVQVWVPLRLEQESQFYKQMQRFVAAMVLLASAIALVYLSFPAAWKSLHRSRRRRWARRSGPVARIEVAYAEFRDHCTDLGLEGTHRTPLRFLDGFVEDAEHTELAWLVTRTLWGDLRDDVTAADGDAAEEIARAVRRRLAATQPLTVRLIAAVSRLSVRDPYAADVRPPTRKERAHVALVSAS